MDCSLSINVIDLMNQYADCLSAENGETQEKKSLINRLQNVLVIGMNHLHLGQVCTIEKFSERFSADFSDDPVVKLINRIRLMTFASRVILQQTLPSEVRAIIQIFSDDINGEPSLKESMLSFIATRLNEAASQAALKSLRSQNFANLSKFTQVLICFWDDSFLRHKMVPIPGTGAVISLRESIAENLKTILCQTGAEAKEFVDLATVLIKQQEKKAIVEELTGLDYFHEEALNAGIETITGLCRTYQKNVPDLLDFVTTYCKDRLAINQFLLRPSSRAMAFTGKEEQVISFYTLTWKIQDESVCHCRVQCAKEKNGKVMWLLPLDEKEWMGFESLKALIDYFVQPRNRALLPVPNRLLTPAPKPNKKVATNYAVNYFTKILPGNGT